MHPIAIDTETELATEDSPVPRLVSVATSDGTDTRLYHHADAWVPYVRWCLDGPGAIFHSARYDVFTLLRAAPELTTSIVNALEQGRVHCTQNRERLLVIANVFWSKTFDLGHVAERYQIPGVDKLDPWRLRYGELFTVPIAHWPEEARRYATTDAWATVLVWHAQNLALSRWQAETGRTDDLFGDSPRQVRKSIGLYAQTLRGAHTDQAMVDALDITLSNRINLAAHELLAAELLRWQGKARPKLVKDTKAAKAMLSAWLGYDPGTLKEEALIDANLPEGHPLLVYQAYGSALTARSGWVDVLRHPIVRCRYTETVTSGRTSSSDPGEPFVGRNLQNWPKPHTFPGANFRGCMRSAPGHRLVVSDYSSQEMVCMGQIEIDLFGRSALADSLRAGIDPHAQVGARLLGIDLARFDRKNPEHENVRSLAKPYNFGKLGGMGSERFTKHARDDYNVAITIAEDKANTRIWLDMFPEHDLYFRYHKSLAGYDGTTTIVQHRSGRVRGGCYFTDACNTRFQGLASDMSGESIWFLWRAGLDPASPLYSGPLAVDPATGRVPTKGQVLFVHDENVGQFPSEEAEDCAREQERIMVECGGRWCPDVPIKVETKIVERYAK